MKRLTLRLLVPKPVANHMTTKDRVLAKIRKDPNGCWTWLGGINPKGYGTIMINYKHYIAHRLVYEFLIGPIPEGLTLDHLCRNRAYVNPEHLEPVTNAENVLRGEGISARNARKTHCKRGHSLEDSYTTLCPSGNIGRICKKCVKYHKNKHKAQ